MKRRAFLGAAALVGGGLALRFHAGGPSAGMEPGFAPETFRVSLDDADSSYDYIVIGSGTAGATLARELAGKGRKVLLLERGAYRPLQESFWTMASMFNEVDVTDELKDASVFTAGGSTAMYLAISEEPPFQAFRSVGIDLRGDYEAVRRELPLDVMPDDMLSRQTRHLRDAALALGHDWKKNLMLIDQSAVQGGYSYQAKWKALSYVDEAVRRGATLRCEALVERVLIENGTAVGVECRVEDSMFESRQVRFHADRIVVSAGSLATPLILQNSGLRNITANGYFIDPSVVVFGQVPDLQGSDGFAGVMGTTLQDGTKLLDANVHSMPFNMFMIQQLRPQRIWSYPEHVGIMVKAHDAAGGSLSAEGRYQKTLEPAVFDRLRNGEQAARRILQLAGASSFLTTPVTTGGTFGTLRVNEEVDANLQTKVENLYVCDGSLIPDDGRVAPALTLVCLARYLARVLSSEPPTTITESARGTSALI